jgi:cyclopropane-fatty-acyl-phospholipid synthase
MHPIKRYSLFFLESVLYGPTYGFLNQLIRVPEPLDPEICWELIQKQWNPFVNWTRLNYPPEFIRRWLMLRRLRQTHQAGISEHYDVANDFYEAMLDKKFMFYSCADFLNPSDTLEIAQQNKANAIFDLIDPQPGEEILELGSGWCSMLRFIEERTGEKNRLHGFTLSQDQLEFNEKEFGFDVQFADFITMDYPSESYDKIYSIGAWEHVRPKEIPALLKKLHGALRPNGRLVKHFFCLHTDKSPVSAIAGQLCFPGSQLSSYQFHTDAFENAGFRIVRRTIHDYRPTLRCWYDNLAKNKSTAIKAGGIRNYNRHIVFIAATWRFFDEGESMVIRFQLEKQ